MSTVSNVNTHTTTSTTMTTNTTTNNDRRLTKVFLPQSPYSHAYTTPSKHGGLVSLLPISP